MAFKSLELLAATKIRSNSAKKLDASFDCYLLLGCHTQIAKNLPMIFKRFQKSKTSNNSFPSSSIFLDHLEPQSLRRELTCLFAVFWTLQQNSMVPEPSWAQNHPGEVEQRSRWTHLCLFRTACFLHGFLWLVFEPLQKMSIVWSSQHGHWSTMAPAPSLLAPLVLRSAEGRTERWCLKITALSSLVHQSTLLLGPNKRVWSTQEWNIPLTNHLGAIYHITDPHIEAFQPLMKNSTEHRTCVLQQNRAWKNGGDLPGFDSHGGESNASIKMRQMLCT